jgi:hypothetical protein
MPAPASEARADPGQALPPRPASRSPHQSRRCVPRAPRPRQQENRCPRHTQFQGLRRYAPGRRYLLPLDPSANTHTRRRGPEQPDSQISRMRGHSQRDRPTSKRTPGTIGPPARGGDSPSALADAAVTLCGSEQGPSARPAASAVIAAPGSSAGTSGKPSDLCCSAAPGATGSEGAESTALVAASWLLLVP